MYTRYVYDRIFWKNKSESLDTPLGQSNLNHMDSAIYQIAENLDVVYNESSTGKFDISDAGKVIVGMPTWDPDTGILTFQFYDGTQFSVDFNIEKIPVSFSMDSAGVITMTTSDGTQWTADIGDVVPDYVFEDSERIVFSKTKNADGGNRISADIKKNSITDEYLQPNYLAELTAQASSAAASAQLSSDFADSAAYEAKLAQSYSIGGSGIREGEDTDNAKYYKEQSANSAESARNALEQMQSAQVTGVKGDAESSYRRGNVNITKEDLGIQDTWTQIAVLNNGQSVTVPSSAKEILIHCTNGASSAAVYATYTFPVGEVYSVLIYNGNTYTNLAGLKADGTITASSSIVVFYR